MSFRIIPILNMIEGTLVKGVSFQNHKIVGDPINTVIIFSYYQVDELVITDISGQTSEIDYRFLEKVARVAKMPITYGGGIKTLEMAVRILNLGFERISLNSLLHENLDEVARIIENVGSQAVVGSVDYWEDAIHVKKMINKKTILNQSQLSQHCENISKIGVGEILLTCANREGGWNGLDLGTIEQITGKQEIRIIAHGGVGSIQHLREGIENQNLVAIGAGSFFVHHKKDQGILISVPNGFSGRLGDYS